MSSYDIHLMPRPQAFDLVVCGRPSQFDIFTINNSSFGDIVINNSLSFDLIAEKDKTYDIFVRKLAHSQGGDGGRYRTLFDLDDKELATLDNLTLSALEYMEA